MRAYRWIEIVLIGWTMCGTVNCVNEVAAKEKDVPPSPYTETLPAGSLGDPAEQGGQGGNPVLDLPLAGGDETVCTQGVEGSVSHQTRATRYDLDIDTPNNADLPLFAPCSGVAGVHTEDPSRNFGNHMNIDRGDGTYCVVAHMKSVFIPNGDEVVAGQIIGIEGCTGFCTGDHVHVGIHRGNAADMAQFGESIPASYRLSGELEPVAGRDIVCGTGRVYVSKLPIAHAHPDGTLGKTVGDARVYLLGDGLKRHIANETVFLESGLDFRDVVNVSEQELDCYQEGDPISVAMPVQTGLRNGMLVREASQSDVYVLADGFAMPVLDWQTFLWLGYDPARIQFLADGDIEAAGYQFGSCAAGFSCLDRAEMSVCRAADDLGGGITEGDNLPIQGEEGEGEGDDTSSGTDGTDDGGGDDPDPETPDDSGDGPSGDPADPSEEASNPPAPGGAEERLLSVMWQTPFGTPAARITLSGEYRLTDGTWGLVWHDLKEVFDAPELTFTLPGVAAGGHFRFSVEFEDSGGYVSWGCIAPFPPGTLQGSVEADVDGVHVPVIATAAPTSPGCEFTLTVP